MLALYLFIGLIIGGIAASEKTIRDSKDGSLQFSAVVVSLIIWPAIAAMLLIEGEWE